MPTYRIVTLGCKLNQSDSAGLESRLRGLGMARASEDLPADVVVLNTCTVTHLADREARQIARRLRRDNPAATLIATGCYVTRDPAPLGSDPGVDHLVPLREQAERIPAIAADAVGLARTAPDGPASDGHAPHGAFGPADAVREVGASGATGSCDPPAAEDSDRTRAYLKIQDGCDLRCAYCVIPSVRGGSRSLAPEEVLRRIDRLIAAGFREIVLTGVNTGGYGLDLTPPATLAGMLRRAAAVPGLGRLRLNSLEPRTVTDDLIACLADSDGRIAPHVQVPLQSGSDAVLSRMRRNYRTADYLRVADRLRRAVPGMAVGADVIVGFPGESDAEFDHTQRFIESAGIHYLHVFSYSPRPGTAAVALPGAVPPPVVRERSARLRALGRDLSLRFRRSLVGQERSVLTLRGSRRAGTLRALTDNFIDLDLDLQGHDPSGMQNRIMRARITAADEAGTRAAPA